MIEIVQDNSLTSKDGEVARALSFDGRICILRSRDPIDVMGWVNDRIGDSPRKPQFQDSVSQTDTVTTTSSSGGHTHSVAQDPTADNDRLLKVWEDEMAAWKDFAGRAQADGDVVLGKK